MTNNIELRRLARAGIAAFPPTALSDLASTCWDLGETASDARLCSLARIVGAIAELFDENDSHPPSVESVRQLDYALRYYVNMILDEQWSEAAGALARMLREDVNRIIMDFS